MHIYIYIFFYVFAINRLILLNTCECLGDLAIFVPSARAKFEELIMIGQWSEIRAS